MRQNRWRQRNEQSQRNDGGRVATGKTVDKPFRRRARLLRLINQPRNLGQRALAAGAFRYDLKGPFSVDRAGKNGITGRFLHRQALARDRRLIDGRSAAFDPSVNGNPFAGLDQYAIARL